MNPAGLFPLGLQVTQLMRSQWWQESRIRRHQSRALEAILSHATERIPHYQGLARRSASQTPFDWLQDFPILTKAAVQASGGRLIAPSRPRDAFKSSDSSGTTGESVRTYFDDRTWSLTKYALKARRVLNVSKSIRQRFVSVAELADDGSKPLNTISAGGWLFAHAYLFVDDDIDTNLERLLGFGPSQIYGFPSYINYIARTLEERGLDCPKVPVIFTSSETLTEPMRQSLARSYQSQVYDVYGSTEFKEIAVQCQFGRYHINFESVLVEEAPDPQTSLPKLLITTLLNEAMPLIRYEIGDHGRVSAGVCRCGREGPYLTELAGRTAEFITFSDGTVVAPYPLYTVIDRYSEVRNFQLIHNEEDELRIKLHSYPQLSEERLQDLYRQILKLLPSVARVKLENLGDRLPEGKRAAIRRSDADERQ